MDGLSALSLAANIIQVVDVSAKIIHGAQELYKSASGTSEENRSLESVIREMQQLTVKFEAPPAGQPDDDDKALRRLAAECKLLSDNLLDCLSDIVPKDPKSRRQVTLSALKNMWSVRDKRELERRLDSCRSQLGLQLAYVIRHVAIVS